MRPWWLALLIACAQLLQDGEEATPARHGPASLVSYVLGEPVVVRQYDEWHRARAGGGTDVEGLTSTIWRDPAGKMRVEPEGSDDRPVVLLDPQNRIKTVLWGRQRAALRIRGSNAGGLAYGVGGLGEALDPGEWQMRREQLGARNLNGMEAEGERTTATQPGGAVAIYECWYSKAVGLLMLATATGPGWAHEARITSVERQTPDPSLFSIPAGYMIEDIHPSEE